jgi:hypothetical protein
MLEGWKEILKKKKKIRCFPWISFCCSFPYNFYFLISLMILQINVIFCYDNLQSYIKIYYFMNTNTEKFTIEVLSYKSFLFCFYSGSRSVPRQIVIRPLKNFSWKSPVLYLWIILREKQITWFGRLCFLRSRAEYFAATVTLWPRAEPGSNFHPVTGSPDWSCRGFFQPLLTSLQY